MSEEVNFLKAKILATLQEQARVSEKWMSKDTNISQLVDMAEQMRQILEANRKLLICGNGGSLCQAQHFAEELTGRFRSDRKPLAAIALADASHISCVGNDYGFAEIFSRSVQAFGQAGDGLILLSTSGNSTNLVTAAAAARAQSITTFALLGRDGGKLKGACDFELIVSAQTSDIIQNMHMVIIHLIIEAIERILFPGHY